MTDKIPLGLPILDAALGGGIPRGYVILLEVDTGTRVDAFISTFLATGLQKGEHAYILCTEYPLRFPFEQLRYKGIKVDELLESKQMVGIDAFTDAFGWGEFEPESEFSVQDLRNTRHVHDIIHKAVLIMNPEDNLRGVVDSLTSIIHTAQEPGEVIKSVHQQVSAQKNNGGILIYTIAREAHDEELLRQLEHIVDGVIALYKVYDEQGWQIACQIEKMRGIDFEPQLLLYQVKDGEITLTPFIEFEEEEVEEGEEAEEEEEELVDEEEEEEELVDEEEEEEELVDEEEEEVEAPSEIEEVKDEVDEEPDEPSLPEAKPPPIPPVPEPSEAPESESVTDTSSENSRTPMEPIIFDEPEPPKKPDKTPSEEPDEEDSFFF
ncbi:MAG: RAD55 family ATPase [Candidatus Thorarchaeota archaeon]